MLESAEPLIDVLVPIFNAARTLRSAIESIQRQTVRNIRIFAIDDGSTDDTPMLLASIAREDPRVRILTRSNGGIVDALNTGLAESSAALIARHDADDLADPDRFAEELHFMQSNPDCVAVSCFARRIDHEGSPMGDNAVFPPPDAADPRWFPSIEPYLLHPFLMARRAAVLAVGGYRHVHHAEDTDLYWRLQEYGRLHVMPRILGSYRMSNQSIMSRSLLDGRISAVHSQLAAVAAHRRRLGLADLTFEKLTAARMARTGQSAEIFALAAAGLGTDERAYLRGAYAAKLLELSTYRPYAPDCDDARFIAKALKAAIPQMRTANRVSVRRMRAIVAATLLATGELRAAYLLLDAATVPQTAFRLAVFVVARMLPKRARRSIRSLRGRWQAVRPSR